jgi:predicted type IV restriction endonuclease
MREALHVYVKRVGRLAEPVRGNGPATKPSRVGPLFTILGYGLAGPRADHRLGPRTEPAPISGFC